MKRQVAGGRRPESITGPVIVLGVGLGGFIDVVLHQILQWHHMLTALDAYPATTVPGLEVNTVWDGLFHVFAYACVVTGLFWTWTRARYGGAIWTWRGMLGWMLVGWGTFNVVEGIIDHHLLRLHHVRSGPNELSYDLGFLAVGLIMAAAGSLLARSDAPSAGASKSIRRAPRNGTTPPGKDPGVDETFG